MTDLEIFQILRPIILSVTGANECIYGDPNQIAPSGLYAAVRITQTANMRGAAQHNRTVIKAGITQCNKEGDFSIGDPSLELGTNNYISDDLKKQMLITASINFYRTGAMQAAKDLIGCNFRSDVSSTLLQNGIGWMGNQAINNISSLMLGDVEERAQVSIELAYEHVTTIVYNTIEKAMISFEDEKENEIYLTSINL